MKTQELVEISNAYDLSGSPRFEVKITKNEDELKQARKLRLNGHTKADLNALEGKVEARITTKLIEQHKLLIHDGYDSYAQHLVVKDLRTSKIIAYVRIIDAFTAFKIGGFYCETQFNVNKMLNNQQYHLEISRLVIDKEYDNEHTAQLIWSGITQYAFENGVDTIIGSLSIPLNDNVIETSELISRYKLKHMSNSQLRVVPYQILPDNKFIRQFNRAIKKIQLPYLDYLFSKGIVLCGDAHWNKSLNTAELFIHYNVSSIPKLPHCIQMNEIELGILCE